MKGHFPPRQQRQLLYGPDSRTSTTTDRQGHHSGLFMDNLPAPDNPDSSRSASLYHSRPWYDVTQTLLHFVLAHRPYMTPSSPSLCSPIGHPASYDVTHRSLGHQAQIRVKAQNVDLCMARWFGECRQCYAGPVQWRI